MFVYSVFLAGHLTFECYNTLSTSSQIHGEINSTSSESESDSELRQLEDLLAQKKKKEKEIRSMYILYLTGTWYLINARVFWRCSKVLTKQKTIFFFIVTIQGTKWKNVECF